MYARAEGSGSIIGSSRCTRIRKWRSHGPEHEIAIEFSRQYQVLHVSVQHRGVSLFDLWYGYHRFSMSGR